MIKSIKIGMFPTYLHNLLHTCKEKVYRNVLKLSSKQKKSKVNPIIM
jgi:hypothetical protein